MLQIRQCSVIQSSRFLAWRRPRVVRYIIRAGLGTGQIRRRMSSRRPISPGAHLSHLHIDQYAACRLLFSIIMVTESAGPE